MVCGLFRHMLNINLIHIIVEQITNVFDGFQSEKPSYPELKPVTDHPFMLIAWGTGDSFTHPGGSPKEVLPPWEDPTPEVWLHFKSLENGGTIFYHANGCGYKPADSLTKEQIESGLYETASAYKDKKGNPIGAVYAVTEVDGKKVRVVDSAKTDQCKNIFNQIYAAMGIAPGSKLSALDDVMGDKRVVIANVVADEFNGEKQTRITKLRNPAKVKASAGNESWEEGEE